jgi:signal transduction histidine kinase
MKAISHLSLRIKIPLLIILPMSLVLILSSALDYIHHRDTSLSSMSLIASQTGRVIEHVLEKDMLVSDFEGIQTTLNSIGEDERIQTLYLLDPSGKVIFSPNREGIGQVLNNQDETCLGCHASSPSERPSGIVVTKEDGQSIFRSMDPIENQEACKRCHDPDQRIIGLILTDISIAPFESVVTNHLRANLAWWIGTAIVTGLIIHFVINRWVLTRLSDINRAIENMGTVGVGSGLPEIPHDEIGKLSAAFNEMAEQIKTRDLENQNLSGTLKQRVEERGKLLKRIIDAQEEERKRLAREFHDELGQGLSSAKLSINVVQREMRRDSHVVEQHLTRAQNIISEVTDQMYDLILGLRPSLLDDMGLVAALRSYCQHLLKPTDISFKIETRGLEERLSPMVETTLFRICQEALTNILRHSKAKNIDFRIVRQNGFVEAAVCDDGVGFDPSEVQGASEKGKGLGLLGMRERAELFLGEFGIESQPGKGTKVHVRIPINEADHV